jgi:hypothetical protein
LDGVIYRYTVGNEDEETWSRAKQVPSDKIVAHIEGSWMKQIKYRLKGEKVCPTISAFVISEAILMNRNGRSSST